MTDHATTGRPATGTPRRGLGRGLGSLIPTSPGATPPSPPRSWLPAARTGDLSPGTADWIGRIPPASPGEAGAADKPNATGEALDGADGPNPADVGSDQHGDEQPDQSDQTDHEPVDHESTGEQPIDRAGDAGDIGDFGAYFAELPVDAITANPRQPRAVFDEDAMEELTHSIREIGLLQPVVVRPYGDGGYQLVMGERRWRASRRAGMTVIPAIVRQTQDDAMLRDGLLENLHRAQLNPLEEAAAYQQLLDDFGCTHEELASRIGRSRPQISNTLRLLKLSPPVQRRVAAGVLSAGHARALLAVTEPEGQERLAARVVAEGLSVRSVEELVTVGDLDDGPTRQPRPVRAQNPVADELAGRLGDVLDTRVRIDVGRSKSRITIECASLPDLERVVQRIDPTYEPRDLG